MKRATHLIVATLFVALTLSSPLSAQVPLVNVSTVLVSDTNNSADTTGFGAVSYEYAIGKYEVTISQYATFLNAVAKTDAYNLYDPQMSNDGIMRSGASGSYSYSVSGNGNRPVAHISWFDAARFCNWLHNGATNGADTETGAYALNGGTWGNFFREASAKWWIPSENEWYKAAYYKGGSPSAGYWNFPTAALNQPNPTNPPGSANSANFNLAMGAALTDPARLTAVGAYSGSPGPYGTFDQGGNVYEWTDGANGSARIARGGAWSSQGLEVLSKFDRPDRIPGGADDANGFRVVAAPAGRIEIALRTVSGIPPLLDTNYVTLSNNHLPATRLGQSTSSIDFATIGVDWNKDNPRVYEIRNVGNGNIRSIAVAKSGPHAADFTITPPAAAALAPGETTTLSVTVSPTSNAGRRSAQLSISSDATNDSLFLINLFADYYDSKTDTDGDGVSDGVEDRLQQMSFDPFVGLPELGRALDLPAAVHRDGRNPTPYTAEYAERRFADGKSEVTNNPSAYGLITVFESDMRRNDSYQRGLSDGVKVVTNSPSSYGLVSRTNIPAVRISLPKTNRFSVNLGGTWTRYAQSGMPKNWSFSKVTGVLSGVSLKSTKETTVRITPYNRSTEGPQMILQIRSAP